MLSNLSKLSFRQYTILSSLSKCCRDSGDVLLVAFTLTSLNMPVRFSFLHRNSVKLVVIIWYCALEAS